MHHLTHIPRNVLLFAIRIYKATSRVRPRVCRYEPTCSQYAADCIEKHGAVCGFALAVRRIVRCNPLSQGGYDPAP